jgi:hypothetical protein
MNGPIQGDVDQNSYAGWVDGAHWATLIACFEQ